MFVVILDNVLRLYWLLSNFQLLLSTNILVLSRMEIFGGPFNFLCEIGNKFWD